MPNISWKCFAAYANGNNQADFFGHIFLSQELHLQKSDPEIFRTAICTLNANPDETIFIDDNVENIAAASSCELQTLPAGYRLAHYLLLDFCTKAAKISAFGKDEARSVRCVK